MDHSTRRDRLIGFAQAYLQALIRHDFRGLKIAPNLRNTENCIPLPLGCGAARTAVGLREGGQFFVDIEAGQVEYWGVLDQIGGEVIYGVRLKIEGLLISEIETILVGNTDPYYFPEVIQAQDAGFHEVVPEDKRATRAELIEIANRYFDGIEQNDGQLVPVEGDCLRLVNGAEDTVADVSELGASEAHRALGVQVQMSEGHYAYIEALRGRRFPIVDTERGLVLAHVLFDHPGDIVKPDGSVPFGKPNTMLAFEVFKVVDRQVRAVWAICYSVGYGIASGWGEGERRISIAI
ncbi:hypothetical protein HT136_20330 [Novosphingobium profundi]|uniref:hypothetical protein n=1 Tax=Novosphingobium profundi TaxID=1774954 RepID=UPI001BD99EF2|nr:hypothetical protein [Novosphingobium profundi]MBT0670719.1 hypothetical protein [Novosphingobium profundi]